MPTTIETILCSPEAWGSEEIFCTPEAAAVLVASLSQETDFEGVTIDDMTTYTLRPDGRYEGCTGWTDGFTRQLVDIVSLDHLGGGDFTVTDRESETRRRGPHGMEAV
jgi:hypothetical protein